MLIEQIIEFELRGAWAPWSHMYFYFLPLFFFFFFMTKEKSLTKTFEWIIFIAKILQDAMYLTSAYRGQITYII